jgi:hypothetical protein
VTTADGTVLGATKIRDQGPASTHWNLVFMGDGYRSGELSQYRGDVDNAVAVLLSTAPFDARAELINAYRVDVTSTDSGADDPAACFGGTGATARTYFDASFCNKNIRRLLTVDDFTPLLVANDQVPEWDVVVVIVNSPVYGGSGKESVAVFSLAPNATEIALHELGHSTFNLADEYDNYAGCGSGELGHDHHPAMEPTQRNVTIASTRNTIKWRNLILPSTPIPTTSNPDCTRCDTQPSPVPDGRVGAFEGAHYYHCGAYRPEYRCKMYELGRPFCAVCRRAILARLPTTVPYVLALAGADAAKIVREASLVPVFTGSSSGFSFVASQSPSFDRVVPGGSTVSMYLQSGPVP